MSPLPDQAGRFRSLRWVFAVPCVAIAAASAWAIRVGWAPRNDRAFVQLKVRDVFGADTPLIGMPSTLSESAGEATHHLGPAQFWLLALPFRAVSWATNSPTSISIAASVLALVAVLATAWYVRRTCSSVESWMACGFVCAALWQATAATTASPWNPDFAFVAFVAASTICVVSAVGGATLASTTSVVVFASLSAQAHLSYVLPSIALVAFAFVYSFLEIRAPSHGRWAAVIVATSVVVWSGPLLDVLANGGGNIAAVISAPGGDGAGLIAAFDRFARSLAPWELGLQQPFDGELFANRAGWLARLFGAGALVALSVGARADGRVRRLAAVTLGVVAATAIGAMIAPVNLGTALGAHVQRVWIVPTLLVWATLAVAVIDLVGTRFDRRGGRTELARYTLCAVPMVALLVNALLAGDRPGSADSPCSDAVVQLASLLADDIDDGDVYDSTAISFSMPGIALDVASGLYAELLRRGTDLQLVADVSVGMISDHRFEPASAENPAEIVVSPPGPVDGPGRVVSATCHSSAGSVMVQVWQPDGRG